MPPMYPKNIYPNEDMAIKEDICVLFNENSLLNVGIKAPITLSEIENNIIIENKQIAK